MEVFVQDVYLTRDKERVADLLRQLFEEVGTAYGFARKIRSMETQIFDGLGHKDSDSTNTLPSRYGNDELRIRKVGDTQLRKYTKMNLVSSDLALESWRYLDAIAQVYAQEKPRIDSAVWDYLSFRSSHQAMQIIRGQRWFLRPTDEYSYPIVIDFEGQLRGEYLTTTLWTTRTRNSEREFLDQISLKRPRLVTRWDGAIKAILFDGGALKIRGLFKQYDNQETVILMVSANPDGTEVIELGIDSYYETVR